MRRGDVYWADLGPPFGRRPVLVLTRSSAIPVLSAVVVAPITRTVRTVPSEVPIGAEEGLSAESVANCDTLLTVPRDRFDGDPTGQLDATKAPALDAALRFALEILY